MARIRWANYAFLPMWSLSEGRQLTEYTIWYLKYRAGDSRTKRGKKTHRGAGEQKGKYG
jgi:hypothetical protein